ncbi:polysaccharide pyruvyl transferase family protein [uncultured Cohaesibacter sp.]|uniref:polysaccharide pyruvyl transferase family protein n=1 Tax=uncultured Cohaesibacter sp. TaxID=1002546 RepID=UPI002D1E3F35|nr:polysaccharide pyruvyl transferase family protein [uncultured Cohaesibacter sp.]
MKILRAVLFNDTSALGHHGCRLVCEQIGYFCHRYGIEIVARYTSDMTIAIDADRIDLVIINGEGSLHDDSPSSFAIARASRWGTDHNVPVFLINSLFQNLGEAIRSDLASATAIFVRDQQSLKEAEKAGLAARHVPDLTLSFDPSEVGSNGKQGNGGTVTFTDSTLKAISRRLRNRAARLKGSRFLSLAATPETLGKGPFGNFKRTSLFWIKHLVGKGSSGAIGNPKYAYCIPRAADFRALFQSGISLLVAGRFHAVCYALLYDVPFCALKSNSWKTEALLEEAGLGHRLIDIDSLEAMDLAALETAFGAFSDKELASIQAFRQSCRKKADAMFGEIRRMCDEQAAERRALDGAPILVNPSL